MNREIRNARGALVELTPDDVVPTKKLPSSSQRQSPTSPSMPRSKIRRTKTAMEKPRAKQPLKTSGSQGRGIFEFHVASDGELDLATPKQPIFEELKQKRSQNTYGRTEALSSSDTRNLELSVESTEKSILSGSHIPPLALTSTSTEHPQGLDGTTVLKPVSDPGPFELESPNSDEKITIATIPSRGQAGELYFPGEGANSSRKRSRDEMEATNGLYTGLTEPSSSTSVFSPDKTITVARRSLSFSSPRENCVIENRVMPLHSNNHNQTEICDHASPLPRQVQNDELLDELSLSVPTASATSKGQVKRQKNPELSDQRRDELDSDDNAIGLPKDNYQPRPSKSRSGNGNGELLIPADYSKRPEAVSKKKRKLSRRKTTAFHELIPKEELEEEEDEVVNQAGFEAPKSKPLKLVTEQDELHLENEDGPEVDQGPIEHEVESIGKTTGSTKQRGRPKKVAVIEPLGHETSEHEDQTLRVGPTTEASIPENEAGPRLAKQLTEPKKQRGRPKKGAAETSKGKSSETNDASIESDVELEKPNHPATAKKLRKQGRNAGRPIATSEELIRDSDDDSDAPDEGGNIPNRVLEEIQGNIIPSKPSEKAAASPSPSKSKPVPPETPQKQGSLSKGPDKHSPISGGKVAYRVGLSKRQRIAPLLRIVRKS